MIQNFKAWFFFLESTKNKVFFLLCLFLVLLGNLLETIGIAITIPLLGLLVEKEFSRNYLFLIPNLSTFLEKFSKPLDKNPNWRGGSSFNYCECGKRIGYGNTHCNKCRPRSNTNNPFYGRTHSKEVIDKAKERMIGNIPLNSLPIVINDVNYESYNHASKCLNIPVTTIRWRVLSKNPKYKNYHHEGEEKISYSEEEQSKRIGNPQIGLQRNFNKPFTIDNVKYRTLKDASEKLNIHPMTIKARLKSEKFENYKYEN
jgi:hypothetical protein